MSRAARRLRGDAPVLVAALLGALVVPEVAGAEGAPPGERRNGPTPEPAGARIALQLVPCLHGDPPESDVLLTLSVDEHATVSGISTSPSSPALEECAMSLVGTVLSARIRSTRVPIRIRRSLWRP